MIMRRVVFALFAGLIIGACGDPCDKLIERICADLRDERACDRTRRDMEDFTPELCRSALKIYNEVR